LVDIAEPAVPPKRVEQGFFLKNPDKGPASQCMSCRRGRI
jgi:hypothetical protein